MTTRNDNLDGVQYTKLIGDTRAFRQTAELIEQQIRLLNVNPEDFSPVDGTTGWPAHNVWESLKTTSHFNLGIALELRLKCLLWLNDNEVRNTHSLFQLYDSLRGVQPEISKRIDVIFQQAINDHPFRLLTYCQGFDANRPPDPPSNRPVNSLEGFFKYLDEDVNLSVKRYAWEESAEFHRWHHYLDPLDAFFTFLDSSETIAVESARNRGIIR